MLNVSIRSKKRRWPESLPATNAKTFLRIQMILFDGRSVLLYHIPEMDSSSEFSKFQGLVSPAFPKVIIAARRVFLPPKACSPWRRKNRKWERRSPIRRRGVRRGKMRIMRVITLAARSDLLSLGGRLRVRPSSHSFPVRVLPILCPFSVQALTDDFNLHRLGTRWRESRRVDGL